MFDKVFKFIKVKTRPFLPPKDNIYDLLEKHLSRLHEGDIIFLTSKVLAIYQGRCRPMFSRKDKDRLILQEAEWCVPRNPVFV